MEIRCTECQSIGPAASVQPVACGVALECKECGHLNVLELGAAAAPAPSAVAPSTTSTISTISTAGEGASSAAASILATHASSKERRPEDKDMVAWLRDHALEKLIPAQGDGLRCRKCVHLFPADSDFCTRCGLNVAESFRYEPGAAPWEQAPSGREDEHDKAALLWNALGDDWTRARMEGFVAFVREHDLIDMGIRKLQFRLVDQPDDQLALDALKTLSEGLQSRIIVAQSQAQASAAEYTAEISNLRHKLLMVCFVVWAALLLFMSTMVWDKC